MDALWVQRKFDIVRRRNIVAPLLRVFVYIEKDFPLSTGNITYDEAY